ncbi:TIGR02530 family flagellar biosynthesis protein [Clostridium thermarum]|uniref:TIGR02530 family flagellar biosynthesis protein n=1 Tax=Clostridium thermarum TaxID=1716543 RepID=UPI0011238545|nr:TIGR02530 family flagellar biosynthesis protein [Clostridium thermarum]
MGYRVINGVLYSIGNFPTANDSSKQNIGADRLKDGMSFDAILKTRLNKDEAFNISKHAADRLKDIKLDSTDMKKINEGINMAFEKGAKNCLILYKEVALVTSIENRTIITAVDGNRMKNNVFTNIDSVVIL